MKKIWLVLGPLGLALTVVPPLLFVGGAMSEPAVKALMLWGCGLWFVAAPRFLRGGDK